VSDRYIVVCCTGYTTISGGGGRHLATSFSVLDSACCYREVFMAYAVPGTVYLSRMRLANAECERLNELDASDMATEVAA
jgi:hypothetical protein